MAKTGPHSTINLKMIDLDIFIDVFDKSYQTIIEVSARREDIFLILDWIENNTIDQVRIEFKDNGPADSTYVIGFKNSDDALFFKIKFG